MDQFYRTLLAFALAMGVLIAWEKMFPSQITQQQANISPSVKIETHTAYAPKEKESLIINTNSEKSSRIHIENGAIIGSINLLGARIDDVELLKYKESIKPGSKNVTLLSPEGTKHPYFINLGLFKTQTPNIELPNEKTLWRSDSKALKPGGNVVLTWINNIGIKFKIYIDLDDQFMLHVEHAVDTSATKTAINISALVSVVRSRGEEIVSNVISHEGGIAATDDKVNEITFKKLQKNHAQSYSGDVSWAGFSDKYWLVVALPERTYSVDQLLFTSTEYKNTDLTLFNSNIKYKDVPVTGSQIIATTRLFVGAKNLDVLEHYAKVHNARLFDRAVDFGILYFITKPIFILLTYFYRIIGNLGASILLLTVLIKLLLLPLTYKGFKSMNKMRAIQPQMAKLKKMYANNQPLFQRSLLALYKKEKINPVSGCLPILLQIPIFFALYKVLYITIEMRQAPFIFWIKDLSASDPTSIFNLFGLINWQPPKMLMIGILPILMSFTMFLQQRLSPQPTDATQAKVVKMLPFLFLFMFSSFPSGLLLYWTWSNTLSITQQFWMLKKEKSVKATAVKTTK